MKTISFFIVLVIWGFGSPAFSWFDEEFGLDYSLRAGRYPPNDLRHECAAFSRGYRVPELFELQNAYEKGISDPDQAGEFGEAVRDRGVFYSITPLVDGSGYWGLDMATGMSVPIQRAPRVYHGLLCTKAPGNRRLWQMNSADDHVFLLRGPGKMTPHVAGVECYSHLGNRWLPTIQELESAWSFGLVNPQFNTVYGKHISHYSKLTSSTKVDDDGLHYFGIDPLSGNRIEIAKEEEAGFVCMQIYD